MALELLGMPVLGRDGQLRASVGASVMQWATREAFWETDFFVRDRSGGGGQLQDLPISHVRH
jgi:hypothetical protein